MKCVRFLLLVVVAVGAMWSITASAAEACREQDSCDEGQAWAAAQEYMQRKIAEFNAANTDPDMKWIACPEKTTGQVSGVVYYLACRNGTADAREAFHYKGLCSARPEQTGWKGTGAAGIGSVCSDGCAYDGSLDASSPTGRSFTPNGKTCGKSDLDPPENATPGDGGGDGGGGGGGGGGESGGGNEGGGGGGNGGGGGGGGGDGDGEGEGGGEGGGGGVTPGPGEGEGDGDGPGQTTPPDGKLYKKSQKTMEKVVDDFFEKAQKTQMVKGITDFMKVPGGGSCPTFTVAASKWWRTMTYSAHCSGDFLALLRLCGYVIFAIAAYAAVRIALT